MNRAFTEEECEAILDGAVKFSSTATELDPVKFDDLHAEIKDTVHPKIYKTLLMVRGLLGGAR